MVEGPRSITSVPGDIWFKRRRLAALAQCLQVEMKEHAEMVAGNLRSSRSALECGVKRRVEPMASPWGGGELERGQDRRASE